MRLSVSEIFAPTSPRFAPTSPRFAPTSPRFAPTSPRFAPTSPRFAPTSSEFATFFSEFATLSSEFAPTFSEFATFSLELFNIFSRFTEIVTLSGETDSITSGSGYPYFSHTLKTAHSPAPDLSPMLINENILKIRVLRASLIPPAMASLTSIRKVPGLENFI